MRPSVVEMGDVLRGVDSMDLWLPHSATEPSKGALFVLALTSKRT